MKNQATEGGKTSAKDYYSPGEVAKMYGVTSKTVSNWCEKGRLSFITTPSGHRRIPAAEVRRVSALASAETR